VQLRIVDEHGPRCPGTASPSVSSRCADRGCRSGYVDEDVPEKFHDGWLRTWRLRNHRSPGLTRKITDRLKDVIKSGGEWISSVGS
jgi:fatty-acyl-CoA synthase